MKCAKCGEVLPEDSLFCQFCGAALSAAPEPVAVAPEAQPQPAAVPVQTASLQPLHAISQMAKKINKKHLLIAGAAAAVVLAVIIALLIIQAVSSGQQDAAQLLCPACGGTVAAENQFCRHCGEPLVKAPAEDTTAPSTDSTTAATSGSTEPEKEDTPPPAPGTPTQPGHTHQYGAATCTAPKTCSCGVTSGSALGHTYKTAVTAPTCTSQGYTTYRCSACGDSYQDNYVSAAHRYQNYKCTACGAVDKAHAYEYLLEWVKQNGTSTGERIELGFVDEDVNFFVSYDKENDNVFVWRENTLDGTYSMSALFLVDYYHGTYFGDMEIAGTMNPATFDGISSVNYSRYNGPGDAEALMAELAVSSICTMLDFLEWFLGEYDLGITLADLGFTAY